MLSLNYIYSSVRPCAAHLRWSRAFLPSKEAYSVGEISFVEAPDAVVLDLCHQGSPCQQRQSASLADHDVLATALTALSDIEQCLVMFAPLPVAVYAIILPSLPARSSKACILQDYIGQDLKFEKLGCPKEAPLSQKLSTWDIERSTSIHVSIKCTNQPAWQISCLLRMYSFACRSYVQSVQHDHMSNACKDQIYHLHGSEACLERTAGSCVG